MSREHENYRIVLAGLLEYFGDKRVLKASEVARHDGCDRRTAAARYDIGAQGISIYVLARKICRM